MPAYWQAHQETRSSQWKAKLPIVNQNLYLSIVLEPQKRLEESDINHVPCYTDISLGTFRIR